MSSSEKIEEHCTIFKRIVQIKHNVSQLIGTAKCQFYIEAMVLSSSSEELHQIVSTLSN